MCLEYSPFYLIYKNYALFQNLNKELSNSNHTSYKILQEQLNEAKMIFTKFNAYIITIITPEFLDPKTRPPNHQDKQAIADHLGRPSLFFYSSLRKDPLFDEIYYQNYFLYRMHNILKNNLCQII